MANTYKLISSVTVGAGGVATIDFNSIPQTYTDLKLVMSLRGVYASNNFVGIYLNINGTGGTYYSQRNLYGTGSGAGSSNTTYPSPGTMNAGASTANTFANMEIYFPNYTGSNYKSFSLDGVSENNATNGDLELTAGLFSNTGAITSLSIGDGTSGQNVAQYSTAYLYGIKNS